MDDDSDRDFVMRTRHGHIQAFGELVRRYQTSVFNLCYRMLGERGEAEDLTQEAFVRAYERLETFDLDRPFGPWIRRVAANLCLNRLNRREPPHAPLDEERDAPRDRNTWVNPETAHERAEQNAILRAAILRLPPRYRIVIELRHFQELSYAEISRELGISLSDVKSYLFRARRTLARSLRSDG